VGALNALAAAVLLAAAATAGPEGGGRNAGRAQDSAGQGTGSWTLEVREASERFGIPEDWIRRVIRAESGGRTRLAGRPITSRAGAMGLMQLMPGTWAEMRSRHRLGPDPYDPRDNILAGTAYLRMLYDRFGYPGLFAAYNAGPARYAGVLGGRGRLPAETLDYLAAVGAAVRPDGPEPAAGSGFLFVPLSNRAAAAKAPAPDAAAPRPGSGLFIRLRGLARPAQ
jgi:soluble lytic murein transglycosylase-like protein